MAGVVGQGQCLSLGWAGGVYPQKLTGRQGPLEFRHPAHTGLFLAFRSQCGVSFPRVLLQGFSTHSSIWLTENERAGRGLYIPLSRPQP